MDEQFSDQELAEYMSTLPILHEKFKRVDELDLDNLKLDMPFNNTGWCFVQSTDETFLILMKHPITWMVYNTQNKLWSTDIRSSDCDLRIDKCNNYLISSKHLSIKDSLYDTNTKIISKKIKGSKAIKLGRYTNANKSCIYEVHEYV
jgi:hypothetical protein